jgi:hypothetical protein
VPEAAAGENAAGGQFQGLMQVRKFFPANSFKMTHLAFLILLPSFDLINFWIGVSFTLFD